MESHTFGAQNSTEQKARMHELERRVMEKHERIRILH